MLSLPHPQSPSLFIIYMTVMFAKVKGQITENQIRYRIQGARFDEVLFADDTICISRDTRIMNQMLKAIDEVGQTNTEWL